MPKISKMLLPLLGAAAMVTTVAAAAQATEVTIYPDTTTPLWMSTDNSNGGSSAITNTAPRSGNGSIEMTGDRTRFGVAVPPGIFTLSDITDFGFDWMIAGDSVAQLNEDYTPALRLHFASGELIWEGVYNGLYGSVDPDVWYTQNIVADDETMWHWVYGGGGADESCAGGSLCNMTIGDWSSLLDEDVLGISVGVGSSAGTGYHAFADNIHIGYGETSLNFNFETAADVPEPAALALFGAGLIGLGIARRRKRA